MRKITGYEIGLIAVVVGLIVGVAVRRGSNGRGGLAYQLLAVLLTYSSIAAQYMPDIFQAMSQEWSQERHAVAVGGATDPSTPPAATETAESTAAAEDAAEDAPAAGAMAVEEAEAEEEFRRMSPARKAGLLALVLVFVFVIAFAAPVMAGVENLIGLLIIAFALWEAWKINRKPVLAITGPHEMAAASRTAEAQ